MFHVRMDNCLFHGCRFLLFAEVPTVPAAHATGFWECFHCRIFRRHGDVARNLHQGDHGYDQPSFIIRNP